MDFNVTLSSLKDAILCDGFRVRYKYLYLNNQLPPASVFTADHQMVIEGLLGRLTLSQIRKDATCCRNKVSVVIELEELKRCAIRVCSVIFHQYDTMVSAQGLEGEYSWMLSQLSYIEAEKLQSLARTIMHKPIIRYHYIGYRGVSKNLTKLSIKNKFDKAMYQLATSGLLQAMLTKHSLREQIHQAQCYFSKEKSLADINQMSTLSLEARRKQLYRFVLKLEEISRYNQKNLVSEHLLSD